MRFESLSDRLDFGAKVSGVNLRLLRNPDDCKELLAALYNYGFLVLDEQTLTEREYIDFGKAIGSIKVFVDEAYRHPEFPEIFVVSNVQREGKRFGMDRVGLYWHSDCSFLIEPQPITTLYCQVAPDVGGQTEFADMRSICANLELNTKEKLRNARCEHEGQSRYIITEQDVGLSLAEILERDRKHVPPVQHPAIFNHPFTKREILYVNEGFTSKILGMSETASKTILKQVFSLTNDSAHRYVHHWKPRQLVIWDNRSVLHRAVPAALNNKRLMFRLGISDTSFFVGTAS